MNPSATPGAWAQPPAAAHHPAAELGSRPRLTLATDDANRDVRPAIKAGATGYLLKDAPGASRAVRGARRAVSALPRWPALGSNQ